MPYQLLNLEEVARYLHLTDADVEWRVKNREIPFERRGGRIVFSKRDIDAWASRRILGLTEERLVEYHRKSTHGTREFLPHEAIIPEMLAIGAVDSAMKSKTKSSVLRDLVALAEKSGQITDPKELLESLETREELCPTALPGGLAIPHPRFHLPYLSESSFIVAGRLIQEIHFGAPDGRPTDLIFLLCCHDDRIHLHALSRICMMALKTEMLAQLRAAPDAMAMRDCIIAAEQEVLAEPKLAG